MNMNRESLARLASVLLLGILMAGCASGPGAQSPELLQRIEAARTRSDHESLVTYYEREATVARTNAAFHSTPSSPVRRSVRFSNQRVIWRNS